MLVKIGLRRSRRTAKSDREAVIRRLRGRLSNVILDQVGHLLDADRRQTDALEPVDEAVNRRATETHEKAEPAKTVPAGTSHLVSRQPIPLLVGQAGFEPVHHLGVQEGSLRIVEPSHVVCPNERKTSGMSGSMRVEKTYDGTVARPDRSWKGYI